MIADIALIFHWPPAIFDIMPISEMMVWHRLALERYEAQLKAQAQ